MDININSVGIVFMIFILFIILYKIFDNNNRPPPSPSAMQRFINASSSSPIIFFSSSVRFFGFLPFATRFLFFCTFKKSSACSPPSSDWTPRRTAFLAFSRYGSNFSPSTWKRTRRRSGVILPSLPSETLWSGRTWYASTRTSSS